MEVRTWKMNDENDFGTISLAGIRDGADSAEFNLPAIGSSVKILPAEGESWEFSGSIVKHTVSVGDGEELPIALVEHELIVTASQKITGRYIWDGDAAIRTNDALRFNYDAADMASISAIEFNGRTGQVFAADGADSILWSVGGALAYLMAAELPKIFESQSYNELMSLAGDITLCKYDATKKTLLQAFEEIAAYGGLNLRVSRRGMGLVFYRAGQGSRCTTLKLQLPGSELSTSASNLHSGKITMTARPANRPVRAMGAYKRYEASFKLKPGWDTSLETTLWRHYNRTTSDDWNKYRFVYRKWILNESSQSSDVEPFDFSTIDAESFKSNRKRKFLPCLSGEKNRSYGYYVEYRESEYYAWKPWPGSVWISGSECSIIFDDVFLPADFLSTAYSHSAEVRITASVDSDVRLVAEVSGDSRHSWDIHDYSGSATAWMVTSTSVFYKGDGVNHQVLRDDSSRLLSIAMRYAEYNSRGCRMEVSLGWIDATVFVGDVVTQIDGRDIELMSHTLGQPAVKSVRHEFGDEQKTHLILEG